MESPVMESTSSLEPTISDRITASCPPEPCAISDYGRFAAVVNDSKGFVGSGTFEDVPFKRERPERPGETQSACESRTLSRACSTLLEEAIEEESEVPAETDRFGFFVRSDEVYPVRTESSINLDKLRKREKKWIHMLDNWRYFMDEKFPTVRERCRKGIPPSMRGKAWKYLCGATYQMEVSSNRTVFDRCMSQPGDPKWIDEIEKDLNRQFPNHEMFSRTGKFGDAGKEDLFQLLKAWTVLHPEEGYCQGQAPVASVLLMHMPLRDAFYCFVQICHRYLPDYYSPGLEAVQVDGDILVQLLKEKSRISYQHMKKQNVEPVLYMVEWFMCIFCRTLPWPTVLRVWDMFFCEGAKVLFKVAVVLFKYGLGSKEQCKQYPDLHSIVTRLRNLPQKITSEEFLVEKVCELNLNDADLEKIHFRALKLRQIKVAQK
ncbi:Rab-GAP TBC domain-containing protein [Trichostrongylus colubriformis]|uniref:Rab-GAP TBC domain-containing protein n=1 Tax=Trichostrongylus colubriformis TaxID=6319 RepID=A0AAN8GDF0_TRICO